MNKLFFDSSRGAYDLVTEAFDFIAPAQAGLWNLRWQVLGYRTARPSASGVELENRFVAGAGARYGNLHGWAGGTWESVEQHLARFLLINLCAIYEGWIAEVLDDLSARTKENEKGLQFPSKGNKGVMPTIGKIKSGPAAMVSACFAASLKQNKKCVTDTQLENLLVCYRFFKECRNAIAHSGSVADQKLVDAVTEYKALTALDLGLREKKNNATGKVKVPEAPAIGRVTLGAGVELSLRGVVGFSEIILRLITTLDCALALTPSGEAWFARTWKKRFGKRPFSPYREVRHGEIANLVSDLNLPRAENLGTLAGFLKAQGLMS